MPPQREWFEKDYYGVLGVSPDAPPKDVTKAYRRLARQYHPDANAGNKEAEEKFKEVSAAYDVLGDASKRKEYDEVRRMAASGFRGSGGPGFGGPGFGGGGVRFENLGDFDDLLGGFFGGAGGRGAGGFGRGRAAPPRGADFETPLRLSFEDALTGTTTTVAFEADRPCSVCGGSGAEPGTVPVSCPQCGGSGMVAVDQGPFSFSQPCPNCRGAGRIVEKPCRRCRGQGMERARQEVKVRIPPGVVDGERIRVRGRGGYAPGGGPRGDLWVRVQVQPHRIFERRGRYDLGLTVPVRYTEAVLGADVTVPTPEGPVTVRIPAGTPPGRTLRVKGKGGHTPTGGRGDLMATIDVVVPKKVSKEERELLKRLGSLNGDDPRKHLGG
ncbi:MAG: J domain-containing protein [Actinobacteria bacterium]|nr:J domain-containing protein [Actinomycetota bacterium]